MSALDRDLDTIACATLPGIATGTSAPLSVVHTPDGVLQVLDGGTVHDRDRVWTDLGHLAEVHPELSAMADLPKGWEAWRSSAACHWTRQPLTAGDLAQYK